MTKYSLHVMAGAEWNILDSTGRRVAICHGNDLKGDATSDDILLAVRIVNAMNAAWESGQLEPQLPAPLVG